MNLLLRVGILAIAVFLSLMSRGTVRAARADGCGLEPLKPLVPLGCKDLAPVCTCDSNGDHCHWDWICVK